MPAEAPDNAVIQSLYGSERIRPKGKQRQNQRRCFSSTKIGVMGVAGCTHENLAIARETVLHSIFFDVFQDFVKIQVVLISIALLDVK